MYHLILEKRCVASEHWAPSGMRGADQGGEGKTLCMCVSTCWSRQNIWIVWEREVFPLLKGMVFGTQGSPTSDTLVILEFCFRSKPQRRCSIVFISNTVAIHVCLVCIFPVFWIPVGRGLLIKPLWRFPSSRMQTQKGFFLHSPRQACRCLSLVKAQLNSR